MEYVSVILVLFMKINALLHVHQELFHQTEGAFNVIVHVLSALIHLLSVLLVQVVLCLMLLVEDANQQTNVISEDIEILLDNVK